MAGRVSLTDAQVRAWLLNYYEFDGLDDPVMRRVLRAHGRHHTGSPVTVSNEARALLREKIETFVPPDGAPTQVWRTYAALVTYVQREKLFKIAWRMHASERTVSRERARALALLRAELETP